MEDGAPSFLAVLIDCSPHAWAHRPVDLERTVEHLLVFLNAFHLLAAGDHLLVIGVHPTQTLTLWPPPVDAGVAESAADPVEPAKLRTSLLDGVRQLLELSLPRPGSRLAAALALSHCRMQRARRADPKLQLRALVLHASPDAAAEHLAVMNSVFAAQKLGVMVDA